MASMTVGDVLRHHAKDQPDKPFLRCGDATLTFGEADQRTDELAAGFAALGVGHGDRVAILTPNRIELLELYLALAKLGAIQVPLNAFLKGDFLRHQLHDSQPDVLVTDESGRRAAEPLLPDLPDLRTLIDLDGAPAQAPRGRVQMTYADLARPGESPPSVEITTTNLISILYTSGTTGWPKGCMLSHAYYLHVGTVMAQMFELTDDDILFTALPMFHSAGRLMAFATALVKGTTIVVEREFSASRFMPRVRETGATFAICIGAMGAAMLKTDPQPADRGLPPARDHAHSPRAGATTGLPGPVRRTDLDGVLRADRMRAGLDQPVQRRPGPQQLRPPGRLPRRSTSGRR